MPRFFYYILSLFLFISCNDNPDSISSEQKEIDSLQTEIIDKDNEIDTLLSISESGDSIVNQYALYVQQIKDNLKAIEKDEDFLKIKSKNTELLTADSTDVLIYIRHLSDLINENQSLIQDLKEGMASSNKLNKKYKKQLNELNEMISVSNREVYFLKEELSQLDNSFKDLFEKYNIQALTINALTDELNNIGYVIGSKSELLENGILTKEGGFIGIGKHRKLSNELNTEYFNYADKQHLKYIPVGAKNIRLITSHSSNSYLLKGDDFVDSLEILDREEFWKNSKYLVIEVK